MTVRNFTKIERLRGLTIIELMVALAIAAVLASLAAPSFQNSIRNNRVVSAAGGIQSAISLARAEALARGSRVVVCASDKPDDPVPACGADWAKGWVVFADVDANDAPNADTDVIKVGDVTPQVVVVGDSLVGFGTRGRALNADGTRLAADKTLTLDSEDCTSGVNKRVVLTILTTGRTAYNSEEECP